MKVSLLIANYNNGKYFQDCWQSIVGQTYENWEVIIVDDGSTDDSVNIIRQIVNGDVRVRFYSNEKNFGCGYTKRRCAELANGDLMGFLDPDDFLEMNALSILVESFKLENDKGLFFSLFNRVNENKAVISEKKYERNVNYNDPYFFNFEGIISHFTLFRKEVYNLTEGIDPYMLRAVDQDLYLKLCEKCKIGFVNAVLYNYRIHSQGISTGGDQNINRIKANYWHWYAINAAAKRRGIYVENLFAEHFVSISYKRENELIINSKTYKLAQKLSSIYQKIKGSKK